MFKSVLIAHKILSMNIHADGPRVRIPVTTFSRTLTVVRYALKFCVSLYFKFVQLSSIISCFVYISLVSMS